LVSNPANRLLVSNFMSREWSDFETNTELPSWHSDELLDEINKRKSKIVPIGHSRKTKRIWYYGKIASAAVFVGVICLWAYETEKLSFLFTKNNLTFVNPTGKISEVILPDSSHVWLNAASKLTYSEKVFGANRELVLTGEACFEVKKDKTRPFTVHTGTVSTTVLGTKFDIKAYPGETFVVSVVRGKVSVADRSGKAFLVANQKITWSEVSGISQVHPSDISSDTSWIHGVLVFDGKNLGDIALILERWYNVKISFANENVKKCELTGKHAGKSLKSILETIHFVLGVTYRYQKDTIVIDGSGCG